MRPSARFILTLFFFCQAYAPYALTARPDSTGIKSRAATRWADSVYQSLDSNQRIAQLLMIRAFSTRDSLYTDSITQVVVGNNVGGVCFFKGTPFAQAVLTNRWQEHCRTPLLIAIDAEWGMGMRLDSAFDFPYQMTLGAIRNDSMVYEMATRIAADCHRAGVNMNLAPVVDINNNPENPVINLRSFGEDRENVIRKGILYMKGLQDHGILSTGKHFPGHGDTDTDSHLDLPVISHTRERLDSVELAPFDALMKAGGLGMMIAHLYIPAWETIPGLPSTLSHAIVTDLLKKKMGFGGFVITDALDMQGVTKTFPPGLVEVMALEAGNDILLLPRNVNTAIESIRHAADSGRLSWEVIEAKCKAILRQKYELGLNRPAKVRLENLTSDLNPRSSFLLNEALFRASVTLLKNENRLLPLSFPDRHSVACVSVGDTALTEFQQRLSWYFPVSHFVIRPDAVKNDLDSVRTLLGTYDIILLGIHHANLYPKNHYGISEDVLSFIRSVPVSSRAALALFGNPYILGILGNPEDWDAVLTTYQDRPEAEEIAAEVVAGGAAPEGRFPVSAGGFRPGDGLSLEPKRLGSASPETFGIADTALNRIDRIVLEGISQGAYPGCEVLFAKNGKIFYHKAFGKPTYEDTVPVRRDDLYDIASVTKIAGTTLAIMKLFEEGRIGLDDPVEDFLPILRNTPKGRLTIREIMAHQAGLKPWIPFYQETLIDGIPDPAVYSPVPTPEFPVRVAAGLYIRRDYSDTILSQIIRSETGKRGEYKYSDLGFYLLEAMVTHLTGKHLNEYLNETFYRPMGLPSLGFNPLGRFPEQRIIPTEKDTIWRRQLLRGDVHDPGAAMLGGVAGHAGLFSDAFDLAALLQMLLNDGAYGGRQYLLPSTIREFTKVQYPDSQNRRGLGFDKPPAGYIADGPACRSASPSSFGHSGFTGTYVWADPENQLIYVFLSNRVCPDAGNNTLSRLNIRTNLHQAMYDLLDAFPPK